MRGLAKALETCGAFAVTGAILGFLSSVFFVCASFAWHLLA